METVAERAPNQTVELTTVALEVPVDMAPYINREADRLKQYALLLYPYVQAGDISRGRAAEILGMHKLDLIELYGEMGLPYFQETPEELLKDLETLKKLKNQLSADEG